MADADLDALDLANRTPESNALQQSWHVTVDAAGGYQKSRAEDNSDIARVSLDLRWDHNFSPDWRAVFADRVDSTWQEGTGERHDVNTLKEGWLSWRPDTGMAIDAGRINTRFGTGVGFNPTDVFREDSVRSLVSIDPESIRTNRLGAVMLRGQRWWQDGGITVIVSPELGGERDDADFSPDWGASNPRSRWLIAATQTLWDDFSPQLLIQDGGGQSPLFGLNASVLINSSTIAYFEYAGGRRSSLAALAGLARDDTRFRSQLATGVTWSGRYKQSITLEYQYDETGAGNSEWSRIRAANAADFWRYLEIAGSKQYLATRQGLFSWFRWQDAMYPRFDVSAMMRYDLIDQSQQYWIDLRRHLSKVDVALQYQHNQGDARSSFGAYPVQQTIQLIFQVYL